MKLLNYLTAYACILTAKAAFTGGQGKKGCFDLFRGPITLEVARSIRPHSCIVYGSRNKVPVEVINYVLENDLVDVNACDSAGYNSITYALIHNDYEAAKALVAHGADLNECGGSTPMIEIIGWDSLNDADVSKAVKFLLHHDADPYKISEDGDSALTAASARNAELVKMFLDFGLDPNHQESSGMTPSHLAFMRYSFYHRETVDVLKVLLDHGADLKIKDECGDTPLFTALETYCLEAFEYFLKKLKENDELFLLYEPNIMGETVINYYKRRKGVELKHEEVTKIISKYI